ncbi:MAG: hypothetical protein ACOY93_10525 [Bacillota bacterium]
MGVQTPRNLSEREMRSLDLKDFLSLIQEDIKELDELRRQRRRSDRDEKPAAAGRKGRRHTAGPEPELEPVEDEPVIPLTLHTVSCCSKRLGAFPAMARVRCPFCERWHRAGDFPVDDGQ